MNPITNYLIYCIFVPVILSYICFAHEEITMHSSKDLGPVRILLFFFFFQFTIQITLK